jgi:uncharacterized protein YwqG
MARARGPSLGCLLSAVFVVASIGITVWRPAVGGPLVFLAIVLLFVAGKRERAIEDEARVAELERLRAISPPLADAWRRLLPASGLGDLLVHVEPHVRAAVRLSTSPVHEVSLGGSRIGGMPDLPVGEPWPTRAGTPMEFVAQFDLKDVARVLPESPLPKDGVLWFFADYDCPGKPTEGRAPVFYRPEGTGLTRWGSTSEPIDAPYRLCSVVLESYEDLPDPAFHEWLPAHLEGKRAAGDYEDTREYLANGLSDGGHKLLGYANPIQGPMELDLEHGTHRLETMTGKGYADPRAKELAKTAGQWRLLLQVTADDNAEMMWGDIGTAYFWIREADLEARRFERVELIVQCH